MNVVVFSIDSWVLDRAQEGKLRRLRLPRGEDVAATREGRQGEVVREEQHHQQQRQHLNQQLISNIKSINNYNKSRCKRQHFELAAVKHYRED